MLSVNISLQKNFHNESVTAFKCNKSLKELIGSNKIKNNILNKINKRILKPGKCSLCFGNARTLCWNQVTTTSTFKSQQTQKAYKIFHQVYSSSTYVIKQDVGKTETNFNMQPNNHRNDVKNTYLKTTLACKHFQEKNHNFNKHAKFLIIDKLTNTKRPNQFLWQCLIQRENFSIQTLDTIYPKGLNQELSK